MMVRRMQHKIDITYIFYAFLLQTTLSPNISIELIISNEGMNKINMRTPIRWRVKIWREKINNAKAFLLPPDQREAFLLANKTEAQKKEELEKLDDEFYEDFNSIVSEHASLEEKNESVGNDDGDGVEPL